MKTILIALLVLTGAAGSAAMLRSTAALGDPRDAAWYSPGEAFAPLPLILFEPGRRTDTETARCGAEDGRQVRFIRLNV